MDSKAILDLIMQIGLPTAALIVIYKKLETSQYKLENRLNSDIAELKKENKEDKQMFNRAISMFELAVQEFKNNNIKTSKIEEHVSKINEKVNTVEKDIQDIKIKIK